MNRYTVTQVCEMFGVKSDTINGYRTGRSVRRKGRVEWSAPAILDTTDYERVIENGRAKLYYYDSAIQKIKQKRGVE